MEHRKSEFIPGIEGLRAIAILAVLINHLDSSFMPGGYLGVDLFFVISGFVVSRSLDLANTDSLNKYLVDFYSKRLKRLFPALLMSFILITLIGTIFFEGIGKSTIRTGGASLLGLSNLYLIHINTDYFGLGSEFNLFLPTWSLGIEEQFYLFFPIFLYWLKYSKKPLKKWLTLVLVLSVITFIMFHFLSKNYQYYFPFSRLWELMTGALLYFATKNNKRQVENNFLIPSLLTLLFIMFFSSGFLRSLSTYTYFSFSAPIVCLISAGLIYSSTKINSKFLTNSLMMFVGKISYSIYLYHFAVLKFLNPGPNGSMIAISLAVVLLISIASFKLIETPVRKLNLKNISAIKLIIFTICTTVLTISIFIITRPMIDKDPFMRPTKAEFKIDQCDFLTIDNMDCTLKSPGRPRLFFIGDSHSNALSPVMVKLHELDKYEVISISSGGLTTTTMNGYSRKQLMQTSLKGMEYILANVQAGDTVLITNQLMTWFSNTLNDDPEVHRLTYEGKKLSHEEALKHYISEKSELGKLFKSKNVKLILTAPFPDFPLHPSKCYSPFKVALSLELNDSRCETSRTSQEIRRSAIVKALRELSAEQKNIKIFDPIDLICTESVCSSYKGNVPVYYDDDHVNFNLSQDIYNNIKNIIK